MSLIKNFVTTSTTQVLSTAMTFLSRTLMARFLGPSMFGSFSVATSLINVLSRLLGFGIMSSAQYYSAKSVNRTTISGVLLSCTFLISLCSTCIAVYVVPTILSNSTLKDCVSKNTYITFSGFIGIVIFNSVFSIVLVSQKRIVAYSISKLLFVISVLGVFLVAIFFTTALKSALISQMVSWILLFSFLLFLQYVYYRERICMPIRRLLKQFFAYGIKTWPNSLIFLGPNRITFLLAANSLEESLLGKFWVAANVNEAVILLHSNLSTLLFSKVSSEGIKSVGIVNQSIRLSLLALSFIFLLYTIFAKLIFHMFFGSEYIDAWVISVILLFGGIMRSNRRLIASFLSGLGTPQKNIVPSIFEILFLVITVDWFARCFGMIGISYASVIAAAISFLIAVYQMKAVTNCNVSDMIIIRKDDLVPIKLLIKSIKRRFQ